jgi:probable rRNA maturation factor
VKKELVNSYKTWNDTFYTIEANIDTDLWCQDLVNSFEKKLYKVLKEFPDEVINITPEGKILISIMFSGDKKVMELNSQFRKINKPTNVLSFPSSTNTLTNFKNVFLGDIIFSIETIISEAKANNKSTIDHLIHLFIHGLLHLLGYDHKTEDEAGMMEDLEIYILNKLSIANPYEIKNEN